MDLSIENLKVEKNNAANSFWDFKGEFDFVDKWLLMGTPVPICVILISYLAFVLKIGPDMMKHRNPLQFYTLLGFYNAAQVLASFFLFKVALNITLREGMFQKKCMSNPETINQVTSGSYCFLLCKMTELLDTVFFVLRKKQNQVTFLHVYHHTLTVLGSWLILKYDPGYEGLFLALINSIVHAVMYAYYGLSAFPSLTKYLWWKKYITKMQLIQFVLILLQLLINEATSECKSSNATITLVSANLVLFIYLFMKFYIQTYLMKNKNQVMGKENGHKNLQENRNINENGKKRNEDARKSTINGGSDMNIKFSISSKPIHVNGNHNKNKKKN